MWRRQLRERAEDEAYETYRRNLRGKLLTPPLRLHPDWGDRAAEVPGWCGSSTAPVVAVLGIDPAFRTGCKIAVIDRTGQLLATRTIYPHELRLGAAVPSQQRAYAIQGLHELLEIGLECAGADSGSGGGGPDGCACGRVVISVGNGTASRETEAWLRDLMKTGCLSELGQVGYSIVDEAGASVYSASPLAAAEHPELDVSIRGAVSIARRLLDPLSELVKIDPKSIGVGLYQHDVDQKRLVKELKGGTEDCVNAVGVDLNTASPVLLEHVAGLTPTLAKAVVKHRTEHGVFATREGLLAVRGIGQRIFHQAAGFLRVHGGLEPLDALPVHPESYGAARGLRKRCGRQAERLEANGGVAALAKELGVGAETLADIVAALAGGAGLDIRAGQPPPRIKVPGAAAAAAGEGQPLDAQEAGLTLKELKPGMLLEGVVRNVVAFGAFVDVGLGHDGLLHVSAYPYKGFVPSVNDRIVVVVRQASRAGGEQGKKEKWRIGLSMSETA